MTVEKLEERLEGCGLRGYTGMVYALPKQSRYSQLLERWKFRI